MPKRIGRLALNLTTAELIVLKEMAETDDKTLTEMVYWLIRAEAYTRGYWKPPEGDEWAERYAQLHPAPYRFQSQEEQRDQGAIGRDQGEGGGRHRP